MSFQHLNLIEPLLKALDKEGYTVPTPIQQKSIPIILSRKDLLGCAQTGTGKTAAFAIPLLQLMFEEAAASKENAVGAGAKRPIKALVLTPTRELAIQIDESFAAYGAFTRLKTLVIFGGVPQQPQVSALRQGIDILVATPGRLLDLMDQRHIDLHNIQFFVLDEADRMLDMGFVHDVKKVIAKLPKKRQTLLFSATMPAEIQQLAGSILVDPAKVEVTPVSSTAETIRQSLYFVERKDKKSLLLHILKTMDIPTALVFTRTKHGADKVAQGLTRAGIRAEAIHGNKSQNARQRALLNFKSRQTRVLVATDIAARGIDIDELTHVINFELPNVPETYVHRIGRTGRAGASGTALSFCDAEEQEYLRDIQKLIARSIPVVEDHPHVMAGGLRVALPAVAAKSPVQPRKDQQNQQGRQGGQGNNGRNQAAHGRNGSGNGAVKREPVNQQPVKRKPLHQPPAEVKREPVSQQAEVKREPVNQGNGHPPKEKPEQQRNTPPSNQQNGRPPRQEQPKKRTNKEALPMPAQGKVHSDPSLPFRINRAEGDERW